MSSSIEPPPLPAKAISVDDPADEAEVVKEVVEEEEEEEGVGVVVDAKAAAATENLTHLERFYKTLYGGTTEDTIQWAKSSRHVSQDDWNKRVHILRHWDTGYEGLDKQNFRAQNRPGYNWSRDFYVAQVDGKDQLLTKNNNRLCIPIGEVFAAIGQFHDVSHKGEHKTYAEVSEKYCNVSREQIKAYIQTCPVCQSNRKRRASNKKDDVPVPASVAAAYVDLAGNSNENEDPEFEATIAQHREAFEKQAIRQFEAAKAKSTNKQLSPTEMKERIHVMTHWDTGADGLSAQAFRRQNMAGYVWNTKFRIHGSCLALRETGKLYIATDQIFDAIKRSHYGQRHAGLHTTYAQLCTTYGNITRQLVSIFIKTCPFCADRKRGPSIVASAIAPSPKRMRPVVPLPENHPIRAYLGDAQALVSCLIEDPALLHSKELTFLREIVNEDRLVSKSRRAQQVIDLPTHSNLATEDRTKEEEEDETKDDVFYYDVVIVGAGAAGIGMATALLRGGLDPQRLLILEKGSSVGSSFRNWHSHTRFISPSWPTHPFGPQDLNAVVPDTTVTTQHYPTGEEYAAYLEGLVTNQFDIKFNCPVEKIEQAGARYHVHSPDSVFLASHVIWCGGEWVHPKTPDKAFLPGSFVHYVDTSLEKDAVPDSETVIVGSGEAGVELACEFARRGQKVVLVDTQAQLDATSLDPSRRLAPSSLSKLDELKDRVRIMRGYRCVATDVSDDSGVCTAALVKGEETTSLESKSKIVLCTGFERSNDVLKDWVMWKEGYPVVTSAHDESTKARNLFLSGPWLRHSASFCPAGSSNPDKNSNNDDDDVLFCFIYKFRTRFAVVAGEVLSRVVHDRYCRRRLDGSIVIDPVGHEVLTKLEQMQLHYKSKGMMLTDLSSCVSFSC